MKIVWIIALLTTLGQHKGEYTGPDGKVAIFDSKSACESTLLSQHLDRINILGTHGKCERQVLLGSGKLAKPPH